MNNPKTDKQLQRQRREREMSGGIEPVKIKQIPQPDWVVIEYITTQGHFRKCLFSMKTAKEHWAKCNDDIKSSYVIRDAEPDDFEGEYHQCSVGLKYPSFAEEKA